ncbi:MAG: ribosomal protein S18-alanine N-acetyltransferase [Bacillota bacterium]|nr:ribosomal protein S18-alanine N-acetyltransferase [Bacillota bacterium]MDW7683641.1 ribosomal protein S18-alanine N-acetyltransferase [Bacillota bacterium]
MTAVIEQMKFVHVDSVAAIEVKVFTAPWTKQAFIGEILDNNFASYYVAVEHNEVVGYAGIWTVLDEAHITTLAVAPQHQGKGIGYALLRHIMAEAASRGAVRMTLEVRASNTKAQRLYQKHGFLACGTRPGYYNDEDALIMWLENLDTVCENLAGGRS